MAHLQGRNMQLYSYCTAGWNIVVFDCTCNAQNSLLKRKKETQNTAGDLSFVITIHFWERTTAHTDPEELCLCDFKFSLLLYAVLISFICAVALPNSSNFCSSSNCCTINWKFQIPDWHFFIKKPYKIFISLPPPPSGGHGMAQLVEALRYKPEGRGFDSRWCHRNFSMT